MTNSKFTSIIIACVLLFAMSSVVIATVPDNPTSITNTTGNYWVNHSWTAGANTNSYNVSVNSVWDNTTTNTFYKATYSPSAWQNITVFGYNTSTGGNLSSGSVSQNTQVPTKTGMDLFSITAILEQISEILTPIPSILAALAEVAIYGAIIGLAIGIVFGLRKYIQQLLNFKKI